MCMEEHPLIKEWRFILYSTMRVVISGEIYKWKGKSKWKEYLGEQ